MIIIIALRVQKKKRKENKIDIFAIKSVIRVVRTQCAFVVAMEKMWLGNVRLCEWECSAVFGYGFKRDCYMPNWYRNIWDDVLNPYFKWTDPNPSLQTPTLKYGSETFYSYFDLIQTSKIFQSMYVTL